MTVIMQRLKSFTARKANRILGRQGSFWQDESCDHVVRDDGELGRIVEYILQNPVKAGLVSDWQEWQWVYVKDFRKPGC